MKYERDLFAAVYAVLKKFSFIGFFAFVAAILLSCNGRSHHPTSPDETNFSAVVWGIQEYPLTIECNVLYAQELDLAKIPQDLLERYYPQDVPGTSTGANCDSHIMYVGQIVAAYISK